MTPGDAEAAPTGAGEGTMLRQRPWALAPHRLHEPGLAKGITNRRLGRTPGIWIFLTGALLAFAAPVPAANLSDLEPPITQRTLSGIANGDDEAASVAVDRQ